MEKNILFIQNNKSFYKKVNEYFSNFNFKLFLRKPNQKIGEFIKKNNIKMVILSNEFYKNSAYDLCKKIRKLFNLPIIILSNNNNLDLILKYFKLGVDDYIVKPIKINVLLAIVKSKFNQEKRWSKKTEDIIKMENIILNNLKKTILINDKSLKVSNTEFKIFNCMLDNKEKVLTRNEIYEKIWESKPIGDLNNITVHINNLRKKLNNMKIRYLCIKTVWGFGYKLIVNDM